MSYQLFVCILKKSCTFEAIYFIFIVMDTEEKIVKCLNCGKEYTGNFCPYCGQKAKTKRLKLREILADLANSIIGGDNKFVNTLRDLCCRPGHLVREYLQGHRSKFYNPLQMLIWIVTIYAVLSFVIGNDPFGFAGVPADKIVPKGDTPEKAFVAFLGNTVNFISYNKLYYSVFLGITLIVPYRIAFRKHKISRPDGAELPLNYTEQFYTILYESCMEMLLATLLLPFSLIKGSEAILNEINSYADFLFTLIVYKQLYCISWWKCIRRNVAAFFIWLVYVAVIAIAVFGLLYVIYFLISGRKEMEINFQ